MFVRTRKNSSGTKSIQVIEKVNGKFVVLKHIGTASNESLLEQYRKDGQEYINQILLSRNLPLFSFTNTNYLEDNIDIQEPKNVGYLEIFGYFYGELGFNTWETFRYLTIARVAYPKSKLKTAEFLKEEFDVRTSASSIYRFMDDLDDDIKDEIEKKAFSYAKKTLNNEIDVIFFDCTTLHYESFEEDDFRKNGYSKVGKFNQPQILH